MNEHTPTIAQALAWATHDLRATSETPRLDAELLLAHVLGWERARLLAEGRLSLTEAQSAVFRDLVMRRAALEPVAYLIGHKEFYGIDFSIDRRALMPRPETELLVELALGFAGRKTKDQRRNLDSADLRPSSFALRPLSIADIGTGSGAIAVALALHLPAARVDAIDISPDALALAQQNVERYGLAGRVRLLQGDLLDPLAEPVDLIVGNLPYTILSEIDEGVRRYEPHQALDGGMDGIELYRRLMKQAPAKLRPGGTVLLEIGATQAVAVMDLARRSFPTATLSVHQDLAGRDRVVVIDDKETRRQGDKETGS
ncbi:MAG TPA: peptide chain release factor N(5)-glutamine methyltransferase [Roseiflexaceae bacterium]